ncbi:hypothetical protein PspKH34_21890 [Parageobacillus sp. KH3-4]|nr:hypothetical protein PspKH34_21890 [Parageobacillus sp. KH3-4]
MDCDGDDYFRCRVWIDCIVELSGLRIEEKTSGTCFNKSWRFFVKFHVIIYDIKIRNILYF